MKLYRHYKNKFYRVLGEVRHSETQEELVLYETRYESPGGKTWVRPKAMFHEVIEVDGRKTPRFALVPLEIREFTQVGEDEIASIGVLMEKAFGEWDRKWFDETFKHQNQFHLLLAFIDGAPVGFKIGYEKNEHEFYSWLGGVHPEFRGLGIATDLMKRQHEWCRQRGYQVVQTKTQNRFRAMLLLNVKHGFDVIGTHESKEGMKIALEKKLN
jgi:GNAT superfamily N-acetyltransferase